MQKTGFDRILEQIAQANQASPGQVRAQLQLAMESAMADPDPIVQAMWTSIPRKGETLTLEEFMDYLIHRNLLLP